MNKKDIPELNELESIAKELDHVKPVLGLVVEKENGEWDIVEEGAYLKKVADSIKRIINAIKNKIDMFPWF